MGNCTCIPIPRDQHRKQPKVEHVNHGQRIPENGTNNQLSMHPRPVVDPQNRFEMTAPTPHMYGVNMSNPLMVVGQPTNHLHLQPPNPESALLPYHPSAAAQVQQPLAMQHAPIQQQQIRVRALYNYQGQHPDDLTFRKGDIMHVSDISSQWWLARHDRTGETGYIPSNYVSMDDGNPKSLDAWYDIGRREADRRLLRMGNPKGTYLIRPSSEPSNYALSVRFYDNDRNMWVVKHYRIRPLDNNAGFYISNRINFLNITDLINYYSRTAEGLCCRLAEPCPRDYRPPVQFRDFEVNRDSIRTLHRLGQGSFGEVWLAKWNDSLEVAVKMRLRDTDRARFIEEALLMHALHHPRIVQLLGVCTQPEDQPVYIITEWMRKGALVDFLRGEEGDLLILNDLIDMMAQISDGMAYLEERNSVHRDLRAANILVDADNSVKVSDFGLAKIIGDENQADHNTKFPIKWTAPEAALHHIFSIKSDVWSFGVLLYEIVTRGGSPYPGMSPRQTITEVDKGYRMPNPHTAKHPCPDDIYNLMLKCWEVRPENRPTFRALHDVFENWASHVEAQYFDN